MDNEKEGFPITAIREIKLLQQLSHKNIVNLVEVVTTSQPEEMTDMSKPFGHAYLVFEYAEHDLQGILDNGIELQKTHLKCMIKQIVEGIAYLHKKGIMHRDIKGGNLLLTKSGIVKIADFGLAREFKRGVQPKTVKVVTRWYRAPEILILDRYYNEAIDVWSVGCVIAELLTGTPIFPGQSEVEQLALIYQMVGMPRQTENLSEKIKQARDTAMAKDLEKTKEAYDMAKDLLIDSTKFQAFNNPNRASVGKFLRSRKEKFNSSFRKTSMLAQHIDDDVIDLIEKMLDVNPDTRITAKDALNHKYFQSDPLPCAPEEFPVIEGELKEMASRDKRNEMIKQENQKVPAHVARGRVTPPR